MFSRNGILIVVALALLAFVCHAAIRAGSDDGASTAHAIAGNTVANDTSTLPDFDGDGTVGFSDFVKFAAKFGLGQGDAGYDAQFDLNDDGEIGFADFLIFAENFGKKLPSDDRAALVALYEATDGPNWTNKENWLSAAPLGEWHGVTTDSRGRVNELNLRDNNLQGTLTAHLAQLTNLEELTLSYNELTSGIPKELGQLTSLTYLRLDWNQLTGGILKELGQLTNLEELTLSYNQLTGPIPKELGQLIKLTSLGLSGNNIEDISPLSSLTNLTELWLWHNQIEDISPVSGLTNLTHLYLYNNNIEDISPVSGLTNLTKLLLARNNIEDISPVSGLTNLTTLGIWSNDIEDISLLGNLTNLTLLNLSNNNIEDISPLANFTNLIYLSVAYNNFTDADVAALAGLIHLVELDLRFNGITEVSALSGLTSLESLDLRGNPLSDVSIAAHVSALQNMGVTVVFDSFRKGDFDVELIFVGSFDQKHRNMLQYVARRWMAVIVDELPDYEFTRGWSDRCGDHTYEIPAGERIDDLRIYVTSFQGDRLDPLGWASPHLLRDETHLPVLGCMGFDLDRADLEITGLHEAGHVLGFGPVWGDLGLIRDHSWDDPNADTHFNGPLAIAAFDNAGGTGYTGAKVPVKKMDGAHWRSPAIDFELMSPLGGAYLSAITVQSFADLGYGVDVTQADPYTLPGATAGAKIATSPPSAPGPVLDLARPYGFYSLWADRYGQGRIPDGPSSILGDARRTGRLESTDRLWGHGENVNLWEDQQMRRGASPANAEPELTCGAGLMNEPIYVVDQQGRVVRTIHR